MRIMALVMAMLMLLAFLAACSYPQGGAPTPGPTPSPTPSPTPPNPSSEVRTVTVQEVKEKLDRGERLVLIDVRPQSQFAAGHLAGAISIPGSELAGRALDFPLDSQVIVYASCL